MTTSERNEQVVRPWVVLLCVAAMLAVVVAGGYGLTHPRSANADSSLVNQPQPVNSPTPVVLLSARLTSRTTNIHRVVVASGLRIDVESMQCGLTRVGSGYATLAATPGSQYCLVRLEVKNISSSPYVGFGATAYDVRGSSFSSESDAELYVSNSALLQPLNPGVQVPDIVPFELAKSDRLVRMSFYNGFNSSVSVPLT